MKHSERCSRLSTKLKQQIAELEKILPMIGESERLFTLKYQARLADAISDIRKVQEEIYDDRWNLRKRQGVTMSLEMQTLATMIREVRDDWTENHLHIIVEDHNIEDKHLAWCLEAIDMCDDDDNDCNHNLEEAVIEGLRKLSLKERKDVVKVEWIGDGNLYIYGEDDDACEA